MKIILSRKGFDSSAGGWPSPILPNNYPLSFPIPHTGSKIAYEKMKLPPEATLKIPKGIKTYADLIKHLTGMRKIGRYGHLDPDIYDDVLPRPKGWKAVFGQSTAQTHLENNGVWQGKGKKADHGDIFLYFGWFRKTKVINDKLKYVGQNLHLIYGYLEVDEVIDLKVKGSKAPKFAAKHPHVSEPKKNRAKNVIYVARKNFSWNRKKKGWCGFNFNNRYVLTKDGMSRSVWDLDKCFKKTTKITYHSDKNWKKDGFHSNGRGQEFVIEPSEAIIKWVKTMVNGK